ncbi:LOW QUALITY PROTEIN: hypothetical protein HID58_019976, partial [Brassica napus]
MSSFNYLDSKINNFDQGKIMCTRYVLVGKLQSVVHIGYSCAEGSNPKSLMNSSFKRMTHQIAETLSPLCWWGCDLAEAGHTFMISRGLRILGLFSNDSSARVMFLDKIHTTAERRCKLSILS